jgi:release factor glutamine methyltransferase
MPPEPIADQMDVRRALLAGAERLTATSACAAAREAHLLLAHALGMSPVALRLADPKAVITAAAKVDYEGLIARRLNHEPIAYILGAREFWSLPFKVSPNVLIPRPDSETLVQAALTRARAERWAAPRVLDLGTGSGCLLLSVLSELPAAVGVGVDQSSAALAVAQENAQSLGLADRAAFIASDWDAGLGPERRFELILSNPPYIPTADIASLMPDVRDHEPVEALDGGADGLDPYRLLVRRLRRRLAPDGAALFEVGAGQSDDVAQLCQAEGLMVQLHHDLAGIARCLEISVSSD